MHIDLVGSLSKTSAEHEHIGVLNTGFSPNKMLFEIEMRIPFDTALVPREILGPEAITHVTKLIDRLNLIHDQAAKNTELSQEESNIGTT